MPSLSWINKEVSIKEAEKAPIFRISLPAGNVLVEGDNLEVMKVMDLMGEKVKIIYFDPPFMFNNLEVD